MEKTTAGDLGLLAAGVGGGGPGDDVGVDDGATDGHVAGGSDVPTDAELGLDDVNNEGVADDVDNPPNGRAATRFDATDEQVQEVMKQGLPGEKPRLASNGQPPVKPPAGSVLDDGSVQPEEQQQQKEPTLAEALSAMETRHQQSLKAMAQQITQQNNQFWGGLFSQAQQRQQAQAAQAAAPKPPPPDAPPEDHLRYENQRLKHEFTGALSARDQKIDQLISAVNNMQTQQRDERGMQWLDNEVTTLAAAPENVFLHHPPALNMMNAAIATERRLAAQGVRGANPNYGPREWVAEMQGVINFLKQQPAQQPARGGPSNIVAIKRAQQQRLPAPNSVRSGASSPGAKSAANAREENYEYFFPTSRQH